MLARACACKADKAPAALHSFRGQVELTCNAIGNECVSLYQHRDKLDLEIFIYLKKKKRPTKCTKTAQSRCHRRGIGFELWNSQLHLSSGSPCCCCCLQLCPPALELTPAQLCFSRPGWRVGARSQLPANTLLGALSFAGSWRGQCQPRFRLDYLDLPACRVEVEDFARRPVTTLRCFSFCPVSQVRIRMIPAVQVSF